MAQINIDVEINTVVNKYGWTCKDDSLYNRAGKKIVDIVRGPGSKYKFYNQAKHRLMSGNVVLLESIESLLVNYYFCKLIS